MKLSVTYLDEFDVKMKFYHVFLSVRELQIVKCSEVCWMHVEITVFDPFILFIHLLTCKNNDKSEFQDETTRNYFLKWIGSLDIISKEILVSVWSIGSMSNCKPINLAEKSHRTHCILHNSESPLEKRNSFPIYIPTQTHTTRLPISICIFVSLF